MIQRGGRVFGFVCFHLFENGAATFILFWQFFKMFVEVAHYLVFGFCQKTQIPFITNSPGESTDGERPGVPDGVEITGSVAQFMQAVFSPGQVVVFFQRGLFEFFAHLAEAGGECLR